MKRVSDKKRAEKKATDPARAFYVEAADGYCEYCRTRHTRLDCHEITAGSSRHRAVWQPNTWLALCRKCHDKLQGASYKIQFAAKMRAVAHAINKCLGRRLLDDD